MPPRSFKWLPPLGKHSEMVATTRMEISQTEPFRPDHSLQDGIIHLKMRFEACIHFVSDTEDPSKGQDSFLGLEIQDCFQGPDLDSIIKEVCTNFRFFERSITCTEKHYDGDLKSVEETKMDEQLLLCKSRGFLEEAMEKEYNKGSNEQSLKLKISQEIEIPDEWLVSWHSWYADMAQYDPGFEQEWSRDIRRPRTKEEWSNQSRLPCVPNLKLEFEKSRKSCPICFDEFPVGSIVAKLPCGHIFDRKCITIWFYKGKFGKCPMCRSDIPRKLYGVDYNRLPPKVFNKLLMKCPQDYDYALVDKIMKEPAMMMEIIRTNSAVIGQSGQKNTGPAA